MNNGRIDVIIPAYNVPDAMLFRCISSIACQSIIDKIDVTIVDDASTEQNYEEVVSHFSDFVSIQILNNLVNGGCGVARQRGIDSTHNEYIMFIDADDTLNGTLAVKALLDGINASEGKYQICSGVFDEIKERNGSVILQKHEQDLLWMHGKLYRRSFIDEYCIRFHDTSRSNEDNGFNSICRLCMNGESLVNCITAHVYYWHDNSHSITRSNNCNYTYGSSERDSVYGLVQNKIYAILFAGSRDIRRDILTEYTLVTMLDMYEYYLENYVFSRDTADANLQYMKLFYRLIYSRYESDISDDNIAYYYNEVMKNSYASNRMYDVVPHITFNEFLRKMKEQ